MRNLRSMLVTGAAVGAAAVGGGAIANAASSTTSSSPTSTPPASAQGAPGSGPAPGGHPFNPSQGGHTFNGKTETLLTGQTAAKVRAAALARVSGTVERVETNVDDSAPYEAHIIKSNGTQVIVEVNRDFTVSAVQTMGGHP